MLHKPPKPTEDTDLDFPEDLSLPEEYSGKYSKPAEGKGDSARPKRNCLAEVYDVLTLIDLDEIPRDQITLLQNALSRYEEVNFDEEFDIRQELAIQLRMVRGVRDNLMTSDMRIKDGTTVQEVKQTLDLSRQLAQTLTKLNKDIVSAERGRALESCFLATVASMPKEDQVKFANLLEQKMLAQKALALAD